MSDKMGVGDILRQQRLLVNLREAARVLELQRMPGLARDVLEAIDVIKALPFAEEIHAALYNTGVRGEVKTTVQPVSNFDDHDGSTLD